MLCPASGRRAFALPDRLRIGGRLLKRALLVMVRLPLSQALGLQVHEPGGHIRAACADTSVLGL